MSLARGIYGIEYNPNRKNDRSFGPVVGWLIALVLLAAVVSLVITICRRPAESVAEEPEEEPPAQTAEVTKAETPAPPTEPPPAPVVRTESVEVPNIVSRPPQVRNLLLRLEEAQKKRDIEMAVSTIEKLRSLPGEPAADIDDKLARELGALNFSWLFDRKNAQWVAEVSVKSGDSASRIAQEHGSTLASLRKLNPTLDLERLRAGRDKVRVMNHPRFNLIVHARTRTADLQLNGKFFKRYDLRSVTEGNAGSYETPANLRNFLAEKGIWFTQTDRAEVEMLLPRRSTILISEL